MAEHDEWTAADDARVRAALTSLRVDVESTPLPDVRFVRARGMARRRRRFLAVGAAAAAAAVVAGTVGYAQLSRPDSGPVLPASRTSASTPTTTTATTATPPSSPLPDAGEWESSLGLPAGSVSVSKVTKGGGVECGPNLGRPTRQDEVHMDNSPLSGAAAYWAHDGQGDLKDQAIALEQAVGKCQAGPGFKVTPGIVTSYSLFSYGTPAAGSGWFAVVSGRSGVALLQLVDPAFNDVKSGGYTEDEIGALARATQARLDAIPVPAATSTTTEPTFSGPKALNETMTVSGPAALPSSNLFIASAQWASPGLTGGTRTNDGPGALEGSTAVASCETADQQAGIGGRVGVVSIRTGTGAASYVGRQRVQLDDATEPAIQADYVAARLAETAELYGKGCKGSNYTVKSTKGPSDGTFRLDTVFNDGSPSLSEWVGVTAQQTPGAVSTVVLTKVADPKQGFAELDRLLALARQK
jgi:hypothetical protein